MLPALLLLATAGLTPTPVTILSGFLGAGKTTCLSHLLSNADGLRLGVVVNDMAKLNIDAALISSVAAAASASGAASESDGVVKLQNGCACCSLSDELSTALRKLSASGEYDHLIVELSGVANPSTAKKNLEQALAADSALGVALDRVVTLIDSSTFLTYFETEVEMAQQPELRELRADDAPIDKCADRKPVNQLLVNQVEGADVVVMNKLDLASPNEQSLVERLLRTFNPEAELEATQFGALPSEALVSTALAQQAAAERAEGARSAPAPATPTPALPAKKTPPRKQNRLLTRKDTKFMMPPASPVVDALGISSFVYSARRPFDSGRLRSLMERWPRDYASPLQRVSLELGIDDVDALSSASDAARASDAAAEAQRQLAANPGKSALRFTLDDRVEVSLDGGEWAAGAVARLWDTAPSGVSVPYQLLLDDGRYVLCADDDDSVVRRATGDAAVPPPHPFRGVLRSKGFCWVNQLPTQRCFWSHAGRSVELSQDGVWWKVAGESSMRAQLGSGSRYEEAMGQFEGPYGDCQQELVFIGVEPMDEAAIRSALDGCLLKSREEFDEFKQGWEAGLAANEASSWQKGLLGTARHPLRR